MRRVLLAFALFLVVACEPSQPTLTTAPPGVPTTTTTIVRDNCDRLAADAAAHLDTVVRVLDTTPLESFRDPGEWPEAIVALKQQGEDLDRRMDALGCDPAEVQARAFSRVRVRPDSGLSRLLIELLGLAE